MKTQYIYLLAILLMQSLLAAQVPAWRPIHNHSKFHYLKGNNPQESISNSIWIDSTTTQNGDSVFYFNRVIRANDPIFQDTASYNQPQFLQMKMTENAMGIYVFQDSEIFYLHTLENVGYNWLFHPALNIQATIIANQVQQVFAQSDSVKTILLSNGDTILLSKQYGILLFPDYRYHLGNYRLTGIENPNLGEQVLDFWEIYDYHIGDVFDFELSEYQIDQVTQYNIANCKWYILDKDTLLDTLRYTIFQHQSSHFSFNNIPTPSVYSSDTIIVDYINNQDIADAYPLEYGQYHIRFNRNIFFGMSNDYLVRTAIKTCAYNSSFSRDYKNTLVSVYDNINYPYAASNDYGVLGINYQLGKGIGDYQYNFSFFESGFSKNLLGYIKDGDTVGIVRDDDFFTTISPPNELQGVSVYPNPVTDVLYVSCKEEISVEIWNMLGEKINSSVIKYPNSSIEISFTDLPSGMYFIHLQADGKQKTIKALNQSK